MINKSKMAISMAVKVSQTHAIQNKITNQGCSRGFNTVWKTVNPANSIRTARARQKTMAFRRDFWSRIMPRVACTTKEAVSRSFSSGIASILQAKKFKTNVFSERNRDALIAGHGQG